MVTTDGSGEGFGGVKRVVEGPIVSLAQDKSDVAASRSSVTTMVVDVVGQAAAGAGRVERRPMMKPNVVSLGPGPSKLFADAIPGKSNAFEFM